MKNGYKEPQNILISRTDKIGDVILTLPLISEIKRLFPTSKVSFLIQSNLKDLLHDYEGIDNLIFVDEYPSENELQKKISSYNFDTVFAVFPRFPLALIFYTSDIPQRIGTAYRWYSFLYNIKVKEHRRFAIKHEFQYNLGLLRAITQNVKDNIVFHFKYSEEEKTGLRNKLLQNDINMDVDYIIVHPGSRESSIDLPLDILIAAVKKILTEFPRYNIMLTGLPNEIEKANKILAEIPEMFKQKIFSVCGIITLRELMILIDNCKLFISNSTGPIHIAGALNKNIVGFYPETPPMGPIRWKPLSDNNIILTPEAYDDMNYIKVDEILAAVKNFV